MQKRLIIFGSTGSIGRNCLEVVQRFPDRFKIVALSANNNVELLIEQAIRFDVKNVAIGNPKRYLELKGKLPGEVSVFAGEDGFAQLLAENESADMAVNALVGAAGLIPTLRTLERGLDLALANKESLVAAGEIVLRTAKANGARIIPIDSEHSAIFQCLIGEDNSTIDHLILTASGGPFWNKSISEFDHITPPEALKHPNWEMGARITIDSATMANKGFEVIEAHWLFGIPPERIEVVIHPQSIVHSMVRFKDGSYIAQMGAPDMKLPIQFALTYPERLPSPYGKLNFDKVINLDFQPLPAGKYPCLQLAYLALERGGVTPAVLNAADEAAVEAFLKGKVKFTDIPRLIESAVDNAPEIENPSLNQILEADKNSRTKVRELIR